MSHAVIFEPATFYGVLSAHFCTSRSAPVATCSRKVLTLDAGQELIYLVHTVNIS